MELSELGADVLIDKRREARITKDWKLSDEIRNHLDTRSVFVFDTKDGQEVYHLPESYFKRKTRAENNTPVKFFSEWLRDTSRFTMTNREYVELQIKKEIAAEKNFEAWLFSTKRSISVTQKK